MKISEKEVEELAKEALIKTFKRIPFIRLKKIKRDMPSKNMRVDYFVTLEYSGVKKNIAVEVKSSGEPRIARNAVNQLVRYISLLPNTCGVFIAPYISPRAAEICYEEGIGYIDLSGNCRLTFDNVYIESQGYPNKYLQKRHIKSLFSPKATRILRVFLSNPNKPWKIHDMSDEAKVSTGQVANVKKLLLDMEWLSETDNGMKLHKPEELLIEWSENYSYRKNSILQCYTMKDTFEFEREFAEYCLDNNITYALTGFSAANKIAPSVRQQRLMAYVNSIPDEMKEALSIKEVSSGSNVFLLIPYDEGVFYGSEELDGIRLINPIQLYLDLKTYKGRGEEAARTVLERVILPSW